MNTATEPIMSQLPAQPAVTRQPLFAALALAGLLLATALPVIFFLPDRGRAAYDQENFHLPTIIAFARQWPRFDLSNYPAASTPGYQVIMATAARFLGADVRLLRVISLSFSLALVAALGWILARSAGFWRGVLLGLPFILSLYVFSSAAWLLPENAAWLGMLLLLDLALRRQWNSRTVVIAGIGLTALVWVRQQYIWLLAPLIVSIGEDANPSRRRVAGMLIASIPAFATLVGFALLWHGLTPPNQQAIVAGINPAGPALALAVTGVIGVLFLPLQLAFTPVRLNFILRGALVGFVVGVIPHSTYSLVDGRFSGLWNAVPHLRTIGGRSPLIVLLASLGGAIIAVWLASAELRSRRILLTAMVAFGLTQLFAKSAFQRYDEPFVLILAAVITANIVRQKRLTGIHRLLWIGPILLALFNAGLTAVSLRPSRQSTPNELPNDRLNLISNRGVAIAGPT